MTKRTVWLSASLLVLVASFAGVARGQDAARPVGEPVLERPTLRSLGAYWIVQGDGNQNATVTVSYRKQAGGEWRSGPPMFRVEKGAHVSKEHGTLLDVPPDGWLFAGSVLLLEPDTAYQIRLTLEDPDGVSGNAHPILSSHTRAEPAAPTGPFYHVVPGDGGGSGSKGDPYRGIAAADQAARPGDTFVLAAGIYPGPVVLHSSGEPDRPIVWRGPDRGEAVLDAAAGRDQRPGRGVAIIAMHDVWLENLTIRNVKYGIVAHESGRLVVRRCHIYNVDYGLTATKNTRDAMLDYFITDNTIQGPSTWPRTKGIEDARGIQITGAGHVVAYNRIHGFADAIDTMPSTRCAAIDFHNNDVSELTDDGLELDYSFRNTRCFDNRITNAYQGISLQPVYGGPVYVFRNTLYNVGMSVFKLHNSPSGVLLYHNTLVKSGVPLLLWTPAPMSNIVSRNNLYVGTGGDYAVQIETPNTHCDFDYDGFAGDGYKQFLKWNKVRYPTFDKMRDTAPIYHHAVRVDADAVFASGATAPAEIETQFPHDIDLRLSPKSQAVDAGQILPGINDGYSGSAPDLGALELGDQPPHYGPRSE